MPSIALQDDTSIYLYKHLVLFYNIAAGANNVKSFFKKKITNQLQVGGTLAAV